ncbi:MAG: AAA family ATPase, partial [Candidatus Aegiribacteria sp.]
METAVRIRRITISREGPLKDDLILEPRLLNLVYGHNETGKTYIVEALISLLFRTGRNTRWTSTRTRTRAATVREWDPRGEIEVSGLEEGVTVFTPGSPRLEDHTSGDEALPEDLSRLMVVRAGETRLSEAGDGVGDEVLRTYLSGNRVLDEVESRIGQETVKNARITDGVIVADNKGLIKDRLTLEHELSYIDELRKEVDEKASLVVMNSLQRRRQRIESRLVEMEDAKRHRAFQVHGEKQKLQLTLDRLPSENDLMDLYRDMSVFDDRKRELEGLDGRLKDIPPVEEDLRWIEMAGEEYLPAAGTAGGTSGFVTACHWLLPALIMLSAAGAFFSRILALAAAAGGL